MNLSTSESLLALSGTTVGSALTMTKPSWERGQHMGANTPVSCQPWRPSSVSCWVPGIW